MKISQRLIAGFMAISLLVGIVGLIGLYANVQIENFFDGEDEHFRSIVAAAAEASSDAKEAESHLILYLTLNDMKHKEGFFEKYALLHRQILIMDENVQVPEAKMILFELKSRSEELFSAGNSLIEIHEEDMKTNRSFDFEKNKELIRKFNSASSATRENGVKLARLETDFLNKQEAITAATELSSYIKRAEGHLMLYLTLNDTSDKEKFFKRFESLNEQISILNERVKTPEGKAILAETKSRSEEFFFIGKSLIDAYEEEKRTTGKFDQEKHGEEILKLNMVSSNIRENSIELMRLNIAQEALPKEKAIEKASYIQKIIFSFMLYAIFISLVFGYVTARNIAGPIIKLKKASENIGKGDLDTKIEITSNDEIGELANSFNKMAQDLNTSRTELRKAYAGLEERVKERTMELAKANKALQVEITEHLNAEERLGHSQRTLQTILDSMPYGIILINKSKKILGANNAALALMGYDSPGQIAGKTCNEILCPSEKGNCPIIDLNGKLDASEKILIAKDGTHIQVLKTVVPVNIDGEDVLLEAVIDITERKKTEEISHENVRLMYVNKAKSEFLASMSHELRTPLNSIIGFSELLKQKGAGDINEKQVHYIENVLSSSKFLLALIDDILDLSKIEAGKMELAIEKLPVPEVIDETLVLLKERATKRYVVIKKDMDPELLFIDADKKRFKQILFNLLNNAIKFSKTEGGTVTITTKKEGNMGIFQISDTGIGIREEDIGRLFKAFEQLDSGISRKYGGTGLGLAITKQLVELHGGEITAVSKYGQGSTFTFSIPISQVWN